MWLQIAMASPGLTAGRGLKHHTVPCRPLVDPHRPASRPGAD